MALSVVNAEEQAARDVRAWNSVNQSGVRVLVRPPGGQPYEAVTRSMAYVSSQGFAGIWLVGVRGVVPLSQVERV